MPPLEDEILDALHASTTSETGFGLLVGMRWWGVGPDEMSASLAVSGISAKSVCSWDIRSRFDRVIMGSPLSDLTVTRRIQSVMRGLPSRPDWAVTTSPHRISSSALRLLSSASSNLVALLGDSPVGEREIVLEKQEQFKRIYVADQAWLTDLMIAEDRCGVEPWGTCLPPWRGPYYQPASLLFVGTPYPSRVEFLRELSRSREVQVIGTAWHGKVNCAVHDSMPMPDVIEYARANQMCFLNIHHQQFKYGLNPQFFDFAASGIPQIVLDSRGRFDANLGSQFDFHDAISKNLDDLPSIENTIEVAEAVKSKFLLSHTIERITK